MPRKGEYVYTEYFGDRQVWCPDVQIMADDPSYVYSACRGYCASLAVFDSSDKCIGWIDTRTLGYETAKAWMDARPRLA